MQFLGFLDRLTPWYTLLLLVFSGCSAVPNNSELQNVGFELEEDIFRSVVAITTDDPFGTSDASLVKILEDAERLANQDLALRKEKEEAWQQFLTESGKDFRPDELVEMKNEYVKDVRQGTIESLKAYHLNVLTEKFKNQKHPVNSFGTGFIFAETATHYLGMTNQHVWENTPQDIGCETECWIKVAKDKTYESWDYARIEPYLDAVGKQVQFPMDVLDIALFQVEKKSVKLEVLPLSSDVIPKKAVAHVVGYPSKIVKPGETEVKDLLVRSEGFIHDSIRGYGLSVQARPGSSGSPMLVMQNGKQVVVGVVNKVAGGIKDVIIEAGSVISAADAIRNELSFSFAESIADLVAKTPELPLWKNISFVKVDGPLMTKSLKEHLTPTIEFHDKQGQRYYHMTVSYNDQMIDLSKLYYNGIPITEFRHFQGPIQSNVEAQSMAFSFDILLNKEGLLPTFSYRQDRDNLFVAKCIFLREGNKNPARNYVTGIFCYD